MSIFTKSLAQILSYLAISYFIISQNAIAKNFPKLKLLYPLQSKPSVSSSFGTYRINHHHSGIDLYTFEGTPVVAAADGVVSMIKQGSGGYGRAVYLKHKGGFVTLYAHLSAFTPTIQKLIDQKQKRRKSFTQKIRPKNNIEFKAGEVIGWSGTSGTDLCHLHFELRYKNAPINPLTHGLDLPDHQPPSLIAIFADPLDERARVEGTLLPKRYELSPRPNYPKPLATALFEGLNIVHQPPELKPATDTDSDPKQATESKQTAEQTSASTIETLKSPEIEIWGNVGLALEVEDRIDGSLRELTPHQIKFFVNDKLIHHLQYDVTSYADKRSTELDFDVARRGPERHLVHRLYRYGPHLKALKRGSTRPLKRLKPGIHQARVEAIDAAGNLSKADFTLKVIDPKKRKTLDPPKENVKKSQQQKNQQQDSKAEPQKTTESSDTNHELQKLSSPPCRLKRKRIPRRRPILPLWRPDTPGALSVTWRPYGLSFKLPKACDADIPLEIDLRINGKRASRRMLSLSHSNNGNFVNLHFNRLDFDKESKVLAKQKEKKARKKKAKKQVGKAKKADLKNKTKNKIESPAEKKLDRSLEIMIGLRGLLEPEQTTKINAKTEAEASRDSVSIDRGLKSIYWYKLKLHEIKNDAYFKTEGIEVQVGEDSVFKPYVTAIASLAQGQGSREYGLYKTFAQPWLPMQKANEIKLARPRRPRKDLGAYLVDGQQRWWVTSAWESQTLSASSTHLATFVIAQDQDPPSIGDLAWDLREILGPRLIIPIADELSGLSKIRLDIDGTEALIEVQRSWSRLIWKPSIPLNEGKHSYTLNVKDRVGHLSEKAGEFLWPPPAEQVIPNDDPRWLLLEPKR